jgi:uncharacterized protein YggE
MRNPILLAGVILATVFSGRDGFAQQNPPPQVVVTGVGEARVTPDRATISVGVQSRATTAAGAAGDNARRQKAILDTLKALGLQSDQLSTVNYNVQPEMQYSPNGTTPPRVTGYIVSNTVRADVRRLDDVAKLIDAALAKGANEISSLQFYSSKADSVRRSALAAAVADARADAEALARAGGGTLGPILEMSTSEAPPRPVLQTAMMRSAAAMEKTPIEPGQQTITAFVTIRWSLAGGR